MDKILDNSVVYSQIELDFVANMGSRRYYVQSALNADTDEKRLQEERPLELIGDSFKKIIVVKDNIKARRNGSDITTIGLRNLLLDANRLEI